MSTFLIIAIRAALALNDLREEDELGVIRDDAARILEALRALAAPFNNDVPPTDDELKAMTASAREGFQSALDDGDAA